MSKCIHSLLLDNKYRPAMVLCVIFYGKTSVIMEGCQCVLLQYFVFVFMIYAPVNNLSLILSTFFLSSWVESIRGMFEMNCLLSYISISTWGTIKNNIYLSRFIQGLHNGV